MQQRVAKPDDKILDQATAEDIELLRRRYDGLKTSTERSNCESHWQEIGQVISPRKIDFVGLQTPGNKRMSQIYDSTGIHANELLAAGLHGLATNPSMQWFSLRMVAHRVATEDGGSGDINQHDTVQKYLSDVEETMWQRIYQPGSNFTTSLHEFYLDLGSFGTAILYIGQRDDGGLLFESRSLAECVIAENSEGRVDTVFRKTSYTVRQMMQMAKSKKNPDGWNVSARVREMFLNQKLDEPVIVIHAVYPRSDREPDKKDAANMPWASCYFEHEGCHQLEMSGYPEFPYLVARWSKYAGEVYGRSPGMTALPDVKMLQAMTLTVIKAAQKIVDPPMWLRDDGVVGQTRTIPGGINYFRGNPHDGVMLMPVSGQALPITMELLQDVRTRILRTFFADMLQMPEKANVTATEYMQRVSERMRLLGPLIGRLESEALGPMVERIFGILTRATLLPPAPQEIQGQEFTVEYVSPIATAQKQQAINGIMQALQVLAPLGPELAGQVIQQRVDPMKLIEYAWDLFNCDPDLLKDKEAVAAQGAQMQAVQQLQSAGLPVGKLVEQGTKALANASKAGIDIPGFAKNMAAEVARRPKAQGEAMALANGASGGMGQKVADEASQ